MSKPTKYGRCEYWHGARNELLHCKDCIGMFYPAAHDDSPSNFRPCPLLRGSKRKEGEVKRPTVRQDAEASARRLAEIRERHGLCSVPFPTPMLLGIAKQAHADRAELLAEVDRLRALCGRAAQAVSEYVVENYPFDQVAPDRLIAELKDASE